MTDVLRARVSLDGKLLDGAGKPVRKGISQEKLRKASELLLTIHPLIAGDDSAPMLSGLPGTFLPEDRRWELVSTTRASGGKITALYRRKIIKAKRVSRPSPGEA